MPLPDDRLHLPRRVTSQTGVKFQPTRKPMKTGIALPLTIRQGCVDHLIRSSRDSRDSREMTSVSLWLRYTADDLVQVMASRRIALDHRASCRGWRRIPKARQAHQSGRVVDNGISVQPTDQRLLRRRPLRQFQDRLSQSIPQMRPVSRRDRARRLRQTSFAAAPPRFLDRHVIEISEEAARQKYVSRLPPLAPPRIGADEDAFPLLVRLYQSSIEISHPRCLREEAFAFRDQADFDQIIGIKGAGDESGISRHAAPPRPASIAG